MAQKPIWENVWDIVKDKNDNWTRKGELWWREWSISGNMPLQISVVIGDRTSSKRMSTLWINTMAMRMRMGMGIRYKKQTQQKIEDIEYARCESDCSHGITSLCPGPCRKRSF